MSGLFSPMPVDLWPEADAVRWAKARVGGKLFDKGGAAQWRRATVAGTEKAYGVYLTWAHHRGALEPSQPMEQRVSPALIESFVADYQAGRAPLTIATAVRGVAMMLRACNPPNGIDWLSELAWSMTNSARPVRPKMPRLVSPGELQQLGYKLMQEGRQSSETGRRAALTYRNGLMIACLAARPMRLGEFMTLRVGTTLVRQDKGWLIDIPAGMTKKGRARRQFFPAALTEEIDYYVQHLRAGLPVQPLSFDNGSLWLGVDGPLRPVSVSNIISALTLEHLGKRVSPHLFRDCAATAIALHAPAHVGITKSVLGHATLRSSQEYYNQAKSLSASSELADVIARFRKCA